MRPSLYSGRYTGSEDIHGLMPPSLAAVIHRFGRWRAARRDARRLAHFSDEALHDIGIARDSIDSAVRFGR